MNFAANGNMYVILNVFIYPAFLHCTLMLNNCIYSLSSIVLLHQFINFCITVCMYLFGLYVCYILIYFEVLTL
jgi:succinate dehydrogenase hydrophobic anchor subunit